MTTSAPLTTIVITIATMGISTTRVKVSSTIRTLLRMRVILGACLTSQVAVKEQPSRLTTDSISISCFEYIFVSYALYHIDKENSCYFICSVIYLNIYLTFSVPKKWIFLCYQAAKIPYKSVVIVVNVIYLKKSLSESFKGSQRLDKQLTRLGGINQKHFLSSSKYHVQIYYI